MEQTTTIKTVLYTILAVVSLAGGVFTVGKWTGRKNRESEDIEKLKNIIEENENKAKSRLYKNDGEEIFVRAVDYEKDQNTMRADIKDLDKKQQAHELTLVSIDSNVKMLVGLIRDFMGK